MLKKTTPIELADMHSHIMPGVDDGAATPEEARRMLEIAYEDGIRHMAVTPHYHPVKGRMDPEEFMERFRELEPLAEGLGRQKDGRIRLYPGTEIFYTEEIPQLLADGRIGTMNHTGRTILVEYNTVLQSGSIKAGMRTLTELGYEVILAHTERYFYIVRNPESLGELLNMGVRLSLNADSIIGENGKEIRKFCLDLLDAEVVTFIGTDAHDALARPPRMQKAAALIERRYGREAAELLCRENTLSMLGA